MPAAGRSRTYGIAAVSLAVHAGLVTLLVLHAPRLRVPAVASGPPEAIIPVLIMPRVPPPAASPGAKPTPIRLHRRPQRFANEPLPIAPLVTPSPEEAGRPAQAPTPRTLNLPPPEDALAANARNALRSRLGCDSPTLSRAEREGCMDRFGAAGRDAPVLGLGIDRDKAGVLDSAAARRQADYNYKRGIRPPSPPTPGVGWDKYRGPPGQAEALGAQTGNDRPAATIPF